MITSYKSSLTCTETLDSALREGSAVTSQAQRTYALADGAGLNAAHQTYSEETTLAASANETIDLEAFGGATDALGAVYNLSKIKLLFIRNNATDPTAILTVEGGATNPWEGATGAAGVIALIPPGGEYILFAPSAAGLAVGSGSKSLKLVNGSGTVALQYDLQVVGA